MTEALIWLVVVPMVVTFWGACIFMTYTFYRLVKNW